MAPNTPASVLYESETPTSVAPEPKRRPKTIIVWRNVILFTYLHIAAVYGLYLALFSAKILTTLFAITLYYIGGLGITAGVHRLWSHKSYKAKLPLRIMLMLFNTLAFQNSIFEWSRDHRVHHKYSETDADPHNAKRGLFFSHVGWLLCKKHPDVMLKGKTIDLSDLDRDAVVAFQKKYYLWLMPVICFIIPTIIPVYWWGETWSNSWFVATMLRFTFTLNMTWFVNSVAHFYGSKPYDQSINPAQNFYVAIGAFGEGWHNYHHVFPWDYKTAELGNYGANITLFFIDFMAKIGWAYELKTVSPEVIKKRAIRTGDGSHVSNSENSKKTDINSNGHVHSHEGEVWGWDDKDMSLEDRQSATIVNSAQS